MTQTRELATVPLPGDALVPPGWSIDVVVPWLREQTEERPVAEAAMRYAAIEAALVTVKADTTEITKARRLCEVRLGELLGPGLRGANQHSGAPDSSLTKNERHEFRKMAGIPDVLRIIEGATDANDLSREAFLRRTRTLKEDARDLRRQKNRDLVKSSDVREKALARYATIVMDPPWDWGDEGDVDQLGRARPTYGTMGIDELLAMPVADWADEDCHLYLWITNRSLPKGFRLLERWGFRYVTCLTWCKPSIGMGNYFRGSTEQVLFGVKGSQPLRRKDVGTWFAAPRGGRHSAKPTEFMDLVESCSPGPYLEVFARSERDGWTSAGAEVA